MSNYTEIKEPLPFAKQQQIISRLKYILQFADLSQKGKDFVHERLGEMGRRGWIDWQDEKKVDLAYGEVYRQQKALEKNRFSPALMSEAFGFIESQVNAKRHGILGD